MCGRHVWMNRVLKQLTFRVCLGEHVHVITEAAWHKPVFGFEHGSGFSNIAWTNIASLLKATWMSIYVWSPCLNKQGSGAALLRGLFGRTWLHDYRDCLTCQPRVRIEHGSGLRHLTWTNIASFLKATWICPHMRDRRVRMNRVLADDSVSHPCKSGSSDIYICL